MIGPTKTPTLKIIGKIKKALLWYFFSLMISLIMVLITPTLPFSIPPRHLKDTAMAKLRENPKPMMLSIVPSSPRYIVLFRPPYSASEKRPHSMAVMN